MNDIPEEQVKVEALTDDESEIWELLHDHSLHLSHDFPYQVDYLFPLTQGDEARGDLRRKTELLSRLEPTLKQMLLPNERVYYAARGIKQSALEVIFVGALWASIINETVFILTSLRVVMLRCDTRGNPRDVGWVLYYNEIRQIQSWILGTLHIHLRDGKRLVFGGFNSIDREAMPDIMMERRETYQEHGFAPECERSQLNLCCTCFNIVSHRKYECEKCGQRFWRPTELAGRSMVFPAWGDFLMKHYALAIFECFAALIAWSLALFATYFGDVATGAGVILTAHGIDAFATLIISFKGHHPRPGKKKRPVVSFDDDGF